MILYGILMEYIAGNKLDSDFSSKLSPDRQIKMVRVSSTYKELTDDREISSRSKVVVTQRAFWTLLTSPNATGTAIK